MYICMREKAMHVDINGTKHFSTFYEVKHLYETIKCSPDLGFRKQTELHIQEKYQKILKN